MRLLILGGTRFLGKHVAEYALGRGHDVTLFHRGRTLPNGLDGARNIVGDRTQLSDDFARGEKYDAIVDTSGYLPRDVVASCERLHENNPNAIYTFVSSISAYREDLPPNSDESAPMCEGGDPNATEFKIEQYGQLKTLCERAALEIFGERALIVRPGLIVGPDDPTDRFTYWIRRVARGGDVLAPGTPARNVQFIDVRDLAEWIVGCLERDVTGTFNASGPAEPLEMGTLLDTARDVLKSDASFAWVSEQFLLDRGVAPWTEMPLWIPEAEAGGWDSISSQRAIDQGLTHRKLDAIVADTHAWDRTRDHTAPMKAGITAEREAELLAAR